MMQDIVIGDTADIYIRIKEAETGGIVVLNYNDFSSDENVFLTGLRFYLFYRDKTIIKKFGIDFNADGSTVSVEGYYLIDIVNEQGLIKLFLDDSETKSLKKGYYFGRAEIIVEDNGVIKKTSFPSYGLNIGNIVFDELVNV